LLIPFILQLIKTHYHISGIKLIQTEHVTEESEFSGHYHKQIDFQTINIPTGGMATPVGSVSTI